MNNQPFSITKWLSSVLYVPRCIACRIHLDNDTPLCIPCQDKWEAERKQIRTHFLEDDTALIHLTKYRPNTVTHSLIWRSKSQNLKRRTDFLASQLFEVIDCQDFRRIILTHVPRSKSKKRETGVDQSCAISQSLGAMLGSPHYHFFAHNSSTQQKSLSDATKRMANAQKAYSLKKDTTKYIDSKTVILIDDVVTSGASMMICADLLRQAGAADVICVSVAVADNKGGKNRK